MRQSIDIEGINYIIRYRENEFIFYIDVDTSKWQRGILGEYYHSMDAQFGDEPPLEMRTLSIYAYDQGQPSVN